MLPKKQQLNLQKASIRYIIFVYFTLTALAASVSIGASLYTRLSGQMAPTIQEENQILINQISRSMDSYLHAVMKLSDSLYYGIIKNTDPSDGSIGSEIILLYDNNEDDIESITLLSKDGQMLEAVSAARLETNVDVRPENQFQYTPEKMESLRFSTPHVQTTLDANENQYRWVISLSRAVEITQEPSTGQGVLLVDVRHGSLERPLDGVNLGNGGYVHLISSDGEIIYHPRAQLIGSGLAQENNLEAAGLRDGNYETIFGGKKRIVTVKTVGYTGWKIVGVTPLDGMSLSNIKAKLLIIFIIALVLFILSIVSSYISTRITDPIEGLKKVVNEIEGGNLEAEVEMMGSYKIQHLGTSIQNMARQIHHLMNDIVAEHESRRKGEFDTLQSQINSHFLCNTLDVVVQIVENKKQSEAVKVMTALAKFFHISLSEGKSTIPIKDKLEHVRNYLMIQHMRYKSKFTYTIEADEDVMDLTSLKLILQPLMGNVIYHGMEFVDGDGEIQIRAWHRERDLYTGVSDSELGMTMEQVERLFSAAGHTPPRRGSGTGVKDMNKRTRLYFSSGHGFAIRSEPDEGTTVAAHLPTVPYEDPEKEVWYTK